VIKIPTVFIVEDDYSLQQLYQKILGLLHFDIIGVAKNGQEAINMYLSFNKKPEIILMDHRMPIKNGIDATKEILQIENTTKIIFASADRSVKEQALSLGAKIFMEKPFTIDNLIKNIKSALNS
jgi:two-component system chemotaxis response regulator CheY